MRPGEKHGADYFFVSKEQFEEWIQTGELCEWALVYGEYKGIPKSQVINLGHSRSVCLLSGTFHCRSSRIISHASEHWCLFSSRDLNVR